MWQRGWNGANPSVVSPRGRGSRGMGGRNSRGGAYSSTALSGSTSRHGGGGSRSGWKSSGGGCRAWIGAAGKGRGGAARLRPESVSSVGLHLGWAREGEEVERGTSNGKGRF